ncbi:MAG TPA: lysine--tRNA ligase [Ktedonobacterales bacterium]
MDERDARLAKLSAIRAAGVDPYPTTSQRTHTAAAALAAYDTLGDQTITLAGRIMRWRDMGKSVFAHIEDGSGRVQVYFKRDVIGDEPFAQLKWLDLGDTIEATGTFFTTKTGERTLKVDRWRILAKSLLPLPAKGAGGDLKLFDAETRQRKRYLDLIANRDEKLPVFVARSEMLAALRGFMRARGFVEVETPVLQPLYGGATARPFVTHHNTLDRDLYLRIAPELYLKRLVVGGMERVYEVARVFRNEGIDRSHNPEFSMMECYQAYADFRDIMRLTEDMVAHVALAVRGTTRLTYAGVELDVAPPWLRMPLREAIAECTGIDYDEHPDVDSLRDAMRARGYEADPKLARGRLIDALKDTVIKGDAAKIKDPLFLYDYPRDVSPLAKHKPGSADTVERFQAFAGGLELGNAFTELNDPLDQRARFEDQARQRAGGDDEAQQLDEDYIEALEVGLPPTGGLGMGMDRLAMLLTGEQSIREVILFPTMREPH